MKELLITVRLNHQTILELGRQSLLRAKESHKQKPRLGNCKETSNFRNRRFSLATQ